MKTQENIKSASGPYGIFDAMDVYVCITDGKKKIVHANSALCKRAGSELLHLKGKSVFWKAKIPRAGKAAKQKYDFKEIWSEQLNGWFNISISGFADHQTANGWIWTAIELAQPAKPESLQTFNKRDKTALRDLYQTLFETSPSGILLLNEDGIIIDVNQSSCRSTNYTRDELIGRHVSVLALPQSAGMVNHNIKKILNGQVLEHEVTSRRKDGSYYYSLLTESLVRLPGGERGILSVSNDITERKMAELALRESEQKFRNIANYTANWESLFNEKGRIIWTNPAAERFTGYTPEEIIAMPDVIEVLIAEQDRENARRILEDGLREKTGKESVIRCRRKDGSCFWLSISWTQILDNNGNLIGIRTSGQNVSNRLEAVEALQRSENLYRQMIENAPIGMHFYELDGDGRLIFTGANPAADRILGLDNSRYIGMEIGKAFPNLKGTDIAEFYKNAAINNRAWIAEQLDYTDNKISGAFEVKAFQTAPGKMVATFSDITKRKKTEEALSESRRLFEALTRMAPVGIFRTDAEGKTTFVNPKWSALSGLSFDEALQDKYLAAIHPDDRNERMCEWKKAVKQKIPVISEYRFVRPNGSIIWVQGQAVPEVVDGQVKGFIGTITDITELIEIQHELIRAKEKAEASNRLKTTFMKNISHEIRTPLNGIFGFAQLIGSGEYTEKENQEFISFLDKSVTRLTKTIDNIMEISLLMSGNMVKNEGVFRFTDLLKEVYHHFKPVAQHKGIELNLVMNGSENASLVITDKVILKRILEEITDNAVKFTEKGEVKIKYTITENAINIEVTDTGIGISEEYLPLIFEPFMQENVYSTRIKNSTGLGLSIVQGSTVLLGGEIKVSSVKGAGTSINLTFPVRIPGKETQNESAKPETVSISGYRPAILIVEDEAINRLFIKKLLSKHDCRIFTASGGPEAIALVKGESKIDIILMDIKMPGMDGTEAVRQIRMYKPGIKIVAVTAYGSVQDREKCLEAGCDDYIAKPFHGKDLFSLLQSLINWPGPEE
ncbi:PAS domain S-box protein [Lentimicrobium sp.]|uniref:hybrid sensor histidine kinase/response regulator n=1 Tax=Lentimicrobium sp. TaxID=2034841 RepID=UPI002BA9D8F0|nr:PAS domain S-box protein [Lentimicrobium sp.]HPJ62616.1 PAS domain S-box protein [Lentimicrobium sp.]HPR24771.1 PAS domain S-box protein [Lentimicrobium sp.]